MRKIKYVLFLMLVLVLYGCSGSNIYATDIIVNGINDEYNVGDTINLEDVNIVITPINITVKPEICVSDETKAIINDSEITFINYGKCDIIFKIKSDIQTYISFTKTVNINEVTYASSLIFDKSNVKVNLNNTLDNKLNIYPLSCSVKPEITYSNNNVVSYNYSTGLITPINVGKTLVTATIKTNKTETIKTSFNCEVTNNIYATNLSATILDNTDVVLKCGYNGKIDFDITPLNYNMGVSFLTSNNLIDVKADGNFTVGNKAGSGKIEVIVKSANGTISKEINFTIIETDNNLNVSLLLNNNLINKLYTGIQYDVVINNANIDYSKICFNGCDYLYVSDNKFKVSFNNSGNINFIVSYSYNLTSGVETITFNNSVTVYNPITDINFGLFYNDTEIIPVNGEYELSLIDENYVLDALSNGIFNSAKIIAYPKGLDICADDFNISVIGDAVSFENNIIKAVKCGTANIVVGSCDYVGFSKTYVVNVNEIKVSEITVPDSSVTLNLEDNRTYNLTYEVMPIYAYDKNVIISKSNNKIDISNNIITAKEIGECVVNLSCGDVNKTILINIVYIPNNIKALVNNEPVTTNSNIKLLVNETAFVKVELMFNDIVVNNKVLYRVNGSAINISYECFDGTFSVLAKSVGTTVVEFYYNDLLFSLNFIVTEPTVILDAKFEFDKMDVNMFYTTYITPNIILTYSNPHDTNANNLVTLVSDNNSIAIVDGNTIKIVNTGKVNVNLMLDNNLVDVLELNIIFKEIVEINSVSQLNNLENKYYLVTSDLDCSKFNTINNFNGELDFNNHSVKNLSVPLFNTVEENAIIKNLNFCEDINLSLNTGSSNYCIIANTNNGFIENISFNNLNVKVSNLTNENVVFLSIVCNINNGNINNINFDSVTAIDSRENVTASISRFNGVTCTNNGIIDNVFGTLNLKNYVKVSGVTESLLQEIKNIDLTLNISTPNKFIGAGLAYSTLGESKIKVSNVNLNINLSGNNNINNFGGVFKSLNNSCELNNISVNFNLGNYYPENNLALFCYSVAELNDCNVTNCTYSNIENYLPVIMGNLDIK